MLQFPANECILRVWSQQSDDGDDVNDSSAQPHPSASPQARSAPQRVVKQCRRSTVAACGLGRRHVGATAAAAAATANDTDEQRGAHVNAEANENGQHQEANKDAETAWQSKQQQERIRQRQH